MCVSPRWGWGERCCTPLTAPFWPQAPQASIQGPQQLSPSQEEDVAQQPFPQAPGTSVRGYSQPRAPGNQEGRSQTAGPQLGAFLSRHTTSASVCPSGPLQEGSWLGSQPQTRHDPQPQEWGAGVGLSLPLSLSLLCLYHLCSWVLRSGEPCTTIYPHYPEGTLAPWGWGRGRRQTVDRVQEGPTASALDPQETQLGLVPALPF